MADSKEGKVTGRKPPPNAGKGRPKGSLNKSTVAVKEALSQAFDDLRGVEGLTTWAKENPTAFYQLWGKMLPLQVAGDEQNPLTVVQKVILEPLSDDRQDSASS
jgi:hypothetical protein